MTSGLRKKLGLAVFGTTVGLALTMVVGEIAIRMSLMREFRQKVQQFNASAGFEYAITPDEAIGYRLKPDQTIRPKPGIAYTINAQGFRGSPVVEKRDPKVPCILFIGDSFTFGYGVNDDETFPAISERLLRDSGTEAECLNLGVTGYNLANYRAALAENLKLFDPDAVVVTVYLNDAEPTNRGVVPRDPRESFRDVWFWSRHELASQWDWPHRKRIDEDPLISFSEGHPKRRDARRAFREIVELCEEAGVTLLFVSAPLVWRSDFSGDYKYAPVQRAFRDWAGELGAPLVDVRDAVLKSGRPAEGLVIPNDGHFNLQGNEFVAGLIVAEFGGNL